MKIFIYHSKDLDGLACGALALRYNPKGQVKLIGYDYNEPFDIRQIKNKDVEMADVSMEPDRMLQLAESAKSFTWFDHHVSAFEKFIAYLKENKIDYREVDLGVIQGYEVPKYRMMYYYCPNESGCEIVFRLRPSDHLESDAFSQKIGLLGQYDTWRQHADKKKAYDQDWQSRVMPFQWGMRLNTTPEEVLMDLDYATTDETITKGHTALRYQKIINDGMMERNKFVLEIYGVKILACNGVPTNSTSFEGHFFPEIHDAMMPFVFDGVNNRWTFSLYTTKDEVDILSIAKSFGGGGHQKACGFQISADKIGIMEVLFQTAEIDKVSTKTLP